MKSGPAIVILSLLLGGCSVLRDVIPSASKERKCKGVLGCGSFEELQHKRVFDPGMLISIESHRIRRKI